MPVHPNARRPRRRHHRGMHPTRTSRQQHERTRTRNANPKSKPTHTRPPIHTRTIAEAPRHHCTTHHVALSTPRRNALATGLAGGLERSLPSPRGASDFFAKATDGEFLWSLRKNYRSRSPHGWGRRTSPRGDGKLRSSPPRHQLYERCDNASYAAATIASSKPSSDASAIASARGDSPPVTSAIV